MEVVLDGVAQGYGSVGVFDDLSVTLRPGVTALVGPNGAGKTRLLRTLATVAPPRRGTVSLMLSLTLFAAGGGSVLADAMAPLALPDDAVTAGAVSTVARRPGSVHHHMPRQRVPLRVISDDRSRSGTVREFLIKSLSRLRRWRSGGLWRTGGCEDLGMAVIEVVRGDITKQHVDVIVTAANESLLGGGGVDGAIHRAAGHRLARAGAALAPCHPGQAVATPAFDLDPPVRHIVHTVGPVWEGGGYGEAEILADCYRHSLQVADELGARSIAFPAIATGAYGFPPDRAATIAVDTLRSTPTRVDLIRLVAFDQTTEDRLLIALGGS